MSTQVDEFYSDGLHEECGVFGVYDLDGVDVASTVYYGLFVVLQSVIPRAPRAK